MGRLAFLVRPEDENPRHRDGHRTGPGWRIRIGTFAATAAMVSAGIVRGAGPASAAPAPIKLTSASCPGEIVQGQESGCVTELQNLLNAHGAGLVVDGRFGSSTLYAVREYQAATAIAVDGRVGPAVFLGAATAAAPVIRLRTRSPGRAPATPAGVIPSQGRSSLEPRRDPADRRLRPSSSHLDQTPHRSARPGLP
ncbi:peptidoglycan-binding domain-containing protein [Streptomyces sp. NPDC051051]|uniref:peptidoglycan-binding domain-containing protein n=1 Tax=Streptomyces sp. NPDC051051 TaxID=3155666 RepID=UPI003419B33F